MCLYVFPLIYKCNILSFLFKELSATVPIQARIHDPIITVKKLPPSLPSYYNITSLLFFSIHFSVPFSKSATISRLVRANEIFREHLCARVVYLEDATRGERDELNSSMLENASQYKTTYAEKLNRKVIFLLIY